MTPFCCNRSRFLLPPAIEFATTGSSKKTPWGVVCHGWLQLRRGRVRRGRQSSDACEVGVAVVAPRRPGCSISRGHRPSVAGEMGWSPRRAMASFERGEGRRGAATRGRAGGEGGGRDGEGVGRRGQKKRAARAPASCARCARSDARKRETGPIFPPVRRPQPLVQMAISLCGSQRIILYIQATLYLH